MIAIDTNILVYAHMGEVPFHAAARSRVTALLEGPDAWAIPWPCVHEFLGVVTKPRLWRDPFTTMDAFACVKQWTDAPGCRLIGEGQDHLRRIRQLAIDGGVAGGRIHDARIAAICLSHGVDELWSFDRDFSRFPSLRVRNPLI